VAHNQTSDETLTEKVLQYGWYIVRSHHVVTHPFTLYQFNVGAIDSKGVFTSRCKLSYQEWLRLQKSSRLVELENLRVKGSYDVYLIL
jgi:hypothetical protein